MWVHFHDMCSGGGRKEKWGHIFIEAKDEDEACVIFYNKFGHNPNRVTCTCCGPDYDIASADTLQSITAYERGCSWSETLNDWVEKAYDGDSKEYVDINAFVKDKDKNALILYDADIFPREKEGDVPQQGYVWID